MGCNPFWRLSWKAIFLGYTPGSRGAAGVSGLTPITEGKGLGETGFGWIMVLMGITPVISGLLLLFHVYEEIKLLNTEVFPLKKEFCVC